MIVIVRYTPVLDSLFETELQYRNKLVLYFKKTISLHIFHFYSVFTYIILFLILYLVFQLFMW